ncbi:secreted antigen 1 [Babesia divergens]|uniref:Secreted antigen 1 n=1 Tax=Babesia divergens TaxID=32595 RepID=A0AAD9GB55_BABDI|nr:secreted antigen 1 [Babesia divergens]
MSETKACDYQPRHDTLKEILEELGKLYNAETTKSKVFQQLRTYLKAYCGNGYLQAFYKDYGSDHGSGVSSYGGGTIQALTQAADRIGREILQKASWTSSHDTAHAEHTGQTCGEKYFNAFKACLPKAYAALFFLFFNVSTECSGIGGGHWSSLPVKGSGQNLNKWLTGSGSDFIDRGFSHGELHPSKTGQNVVEQLKKAVSLRPDTNNGSLQKVLCGFMFVCKWDDALTGHAICFLSTFCSKVSGDSESFLQGKYKEHSGAFKDVCKGLQSSLDPFIFGTSGLSAVCHDNTNLFDGIWDNGKFLTYCDWLKRNIYRIIQSLKNMPMESSAWDLSTIQSGGNAGPFKYGFVFKDNEWKDGKINLKLKPFIEGLTGEDSGSLEKFINFLFNPSTPSSSAATAGGVVTGLLGTGGLGAGAAYGLNLFGFKNLVTGFLK